MYMDHLIGGINQREFSNCMTEVTHWQSLKFETKMKQQRAIIGEHLGTNVIRVYSI